MFRTLLVGALLCACSEKQRTIDASAPPHADVEAPLPPNVQAAFTKPTGTTDADRAVLAQQDLVRRDMAKNDAWVALGHAWTRKARETNEPAFWVNADACASVVLAKEPDDVAAADLRNLTLRARREYGEARQLAERITARHPSDASGFANLTDALLELGRYDEANDAATKLLALGPSVSASKRTAQLRWLNGSVAEAKQTLADVNDAEAHVQRGMIAWNEGDYDGAEKSFDAALAKSSDFPPALEGQGRVAMARENWSSAGDRFRRAFDRRPSVEGAWLLGDARAAAGDAKGAEEAYALVAKHAPTDPRAYSLFLTMRKDRTKEQYSQALQLASDVHVKQYDVYTEDALAWALYRAGMADTAKTAMSRARKLKTPDARFLFHEGALRIAAGDVKRGKEVIAKALEMNRAFDWRGAKEARELLTR